MTEKQTHPFACHRTVFILWLLTPLLIGFCVATASADRVIRVAYVPPWTAGTETLEKMTQIYPSKGYSIYTQPSPGKLDIPMIALINREVDAAILRNEIWFQGVKENYPILAVANVGRYTAVFNRDVFSSRKKELSEFLIDWQRAWSSTDYPYGLQPPDYKFLSKSFRTFLEEIGESKDNIELLSKRLVKHIAVLIDPSLIEMTQKEAAKALVMMGDYYATIGVILKASSNAKKGETYKGRIKKEFTNFIELDKDPCENDLVNIEDPYDQDNTGEKKHCEGRNWDIVKVTKR